MLELLRKRPLFIAFTAIGVAIAAIVFIKGREIIRENNTLRERVRVVERDSPCTNLTSAECALKLFRALPQEQRRQLRISERTLRALERRAERQRADLGRDQDGSPDRPSRPDGDSPGGDETGAPRPPAQPPGSSPPQEQPPQPPEPDNPLVKTPTIKTPPFGPIPGLEVPSIELPCTPIPPLVEC